MKRRGESGYTIVEVMVAILILMAAILPMFKMFDVSLQTATRSSDYDRARALAEKQAEITQTLPYADVAGNTYPAGCTVSGLPGTGDGAKATGCTDSSFSGLSFDVTKRYVELPSSSNTLTPSSNSGLLRIKIDVYKTGEATPLFTTTGVVTNHG